MGEDNAPASEKETEPTDNTARPRTDGTGADHTGTDRGQDQSDHTGYARENTQGGQAGGDAGRERSRTRKDRLRSYVSPRDGDESQRPGEDDNAHAYAVEDAARTAACHYERERGRVPAEMSRTHPGYDIESRDRDGNLVRYIEIKGIEGEWTGYGAGLSRQQFFDAWEEGDRYWLYVVEFARA